MVARKLNLFNVLLRIIVLLCWSIILPLSAQGDELEKMRKDFENYKAQENARFEAYRDKENKAFAAFLKNKWVEVKTEPALPSIPSPPLPAEIIQAAPEESPVSVPTPTPESTPIPEPTPEPTAVSPSDNTPRLELIYFGSTLQIPFDPKINFQPIGISESDISHYWTEMSKVDFSITQKYIERVSQSMQLGDWAKFALVRQLSEKLHTSADAQILFQFFMWNQMGYHARVGASSGRLILLLPSIHKLYGLPFVQLGGNRYYIVSGSLATSMTSFTKDFSRSNRALNMELQQSPVFTKKQKHRNLRPKSPSIDAAFEYNENLTDFLYIMPQTDLDVIFKAQVSKEVTERFKQELMPILSGKSEFDQVSVLLSFVQNSFPYQTDQEQFGKEKYFYVEEILHYPYSDCEDRTVFFAWLVRTLVGLPVIGLSYESHVATAVQFSAITKGDAINWKDKRYIVCDPTYIGAGIGLSMPSIRSQAFRIIEIP